jgi:uncharacterized protein (TIGR00106 family)
MYIGFLIVSPMDKGPSLSRYVKKAIQAVKATGLCYQVTTMGTVVESPDLEGLFEAASKAVEAVRDEGAQRISLSLKVDIRYDKDITMASKLASMGSGPV